MRKLVPFDTLVTRKSEKPDDEMFMSSSVYCLSNIDIEEVNNNNNGANTFAVFLFNFKSLTRYIFIEAN